MFVRSALTIGLPLILIWAFVEELWRGIRSAFRFAWLEVRMNIAAYREQMQREDY
jgi:ABC-type arginine/histidine transport system permease subunit